MLWPFNYVTYENNDGLANRLRLHCLALAYSLKTGRKLIVDWQRNDKCFATYPDLFVGGAHSYDSLAWPEQWIIRRARFHPQSRDCRIFSREDLRHLQTVELLPNVPERVVHFEPQVSAALRYGSEKLGPYRPAVLNSLTPRPEIARRVDEFIASVPSPRVGIHMRLGDFVSADTGAPPPFWGGLRAPIERFIAIARCVQEQLPNASFVLVSDGSDEELAPFLAAVNCKRREKTNNRTTVEGVRDALADLLVLAGSDFIVGTPNSSFNEFASFSGNKPLIAAGEANWQNEVEMALGQRSE